MTTNFFQTFSELQTQGACTINITITKEKKLAISLLLYDEDIEEKALKLIKPLTLYGTPAELDNGFFNNVAEPIKQTLELLTNIKQYNQGIAEAKKQLNTEKEKKDMKGKEKKPDAPKEITFETEMEKVDALAAQEKYSDALLKLPSKEKYPDRIEEIAEKREELWRQQDEKDNNLFK